MEREREREGVREREGERRETSITEVLDTLNNVGPHVSAHRDLTARKDQPSREETIWANTEGTREQRQILEAACRTLRPTTGTGYYGSPLMVMSTMMMMMMMMRGG